MLHCDAGDGRPSTDHEHRGIADGAEPVERLEEIPLDSSKLDRTTRVGTLASPTVRQVLVAFLKENQDVFALSHEDMLGIDP